MDTPNQAPRDFISKIRANRLTTTFALLTVLSVGILAGSVLTRSVSGKEQQVDSSDARPLTIPSPVTMSNEFSKISKQVGPAVVNINTITLPKQSSAARRQQRRGQQTPNPNGGGGDDDQQTPGDMQDFFNRFFGGQGGEDGPSNAEREALGSGFIVDSRGYIITNNHVIDKADKIYVKLDSDPDNPADHGHPAKVIGIDPETDIAVIKIDAPQPLPTVKLGNSDGAQVGDWVIAIGSPFSLSETVTAGIVSAKNRSIDEPGPNGAPNQFQKFIQTDAAINPGNSGGPLVDMAGQVIGMNTAIYTQSMGSQGVGFAMPSNIIANVYNMLISPEHKVVRGSIGITFQGAEAAAIGRVYGFAKGGVLVNAITPNGPASKAGVKPGDVIISIDGKPVKNGDELVADISARKVGSTVQLGILRNGQKQNLSVGISDRAKLFADLGNPQEDNTPPTQSDAGEGKLGITVSSVPSNIATKLGIKGGVMITNVRPGSFADEINLTKGAIITEIDTPSSKRAVTDQTAYQSIVSSLKSGDDIAFIVRAGSGNGAAGGPSYFGGTLP
ncbi:MAG TPA: trypsin-like peptidase domain-containing protein [Acidobacteriaceae bacterium]|jgi:serine protease Do|nr:trypsin-like peptidase domain-containing protein [Acidobacteriaceae bacterium]